MGFKKQMKKMVAGEKVDRLLLRTDGKETEIPWSKHWFMMNNVGLETLILDTPLEAVWTMCGDRMVEIRDFLATNWKKPLVLGADGFTIKPVFQTPTLAGAYQFQSWDDTNFDDWQMFVNGYGFTGDSQERQLKAIEKIVNSFGAPFEKLAVDSQSAAFRFPEAVPSAMIEDWNFNGRFHYSTQHCLGYQFSLLLDGPTLLVLEN